MTRLKSIDTNQRYKEDKKRQLSLAKEAAKRTQIKKNEQSYTKKKKKWKILVDWDWKADNYQNRILAGKEPTQQQEKKIFKTYVTKLDIITGKIVKARDQRAGMVNCITSTVKGCQKSLPVEASNACHCISRWYYNYRRALWNVHAGCPSCNNWNKWEHWQAIIEFVQNKFGYEWFWEKFRNRSYAKPSIETMQHLLRIYEALYTHLYILQDDVRKDDFYFLGHWYDINY